MDVAWSSLGGGHYINDDYFAPILVHLAELVLQVKICVYKPSSDQAWELKELTWMSTSDLTPVHLLPTIDPRLAHKTELIAEIAKSLDYRSTEEWYEARMQATQQRPATLPPLPKPAATPQLFAALHFSIVSHGQLQTSTTQPRCLLTTNITYATVRAIPLGTTSRLPVHDQAWAFAGGLTKHDEMFYSYIKYEPTKVTNKMALPRLIAHRLRQARSKLTHEVGKAKHVEKAVEHWVAHSAQLMRVVAILHEAVQSQHVMQQGPQPPSDYALRVKAENSSPASQGDEAAEAALPAKATKRPPAALEIPVYGTYTKMQTAVLAIKQRRAQEAAATQAAAAQAAAAQAAAAQRAAKQAPATQQAQVPPTKPTTPAQPRASDTNSTAKHSCDDADKSADQAPEKKTKSTSESSGTSRAKMDAPKKGKTETAALGTAPPTDKTNEQAAKKKRTTNKDGTAGNLDKDKKP
jgi:hypothetical protein